MQVWLMRPHRCLVDCYHCGRITCSSSAACIATLLANACLYTSTTLECCNTVHVVAVANRCRNQRLAFESTQATLMACCAWASVARVVRLSKHFPHDFVGIVKLYVFHALQWPHAATLFHMHIDIMHNSACLSSYACYNQSHMSNQHVKKERPQSPLICSTSRDSRLYYAVL